MTWVRWGGKVYIEYNSSHFSSCTYQKLLTLIENWRSSDRKNFAQFFSETQCKTDAVKPCTRAQVTNLHISYIIARYVYFRMCVCMCVVCVVCVFVCVNICKHMDLWYLTDTTPYLNQCRRDIRALQAEPKSWYSFSGFLPSFWRRQLFTARSANR